MTKEQLRHYRSTRVEISQIKRRIVDLEKLGCEVEVTKPLRDLYRKKLKDLIEGQVKVEKAIETLNPTERELVRLRYFDGKEWYKICSVINYEWAQVHRIHAQALRKLEKR